MQEIHTNYNGEPESWEWQENVKEQLSKVKPISNIVIRDEKNIYSILTNREKLECLLQEYEKENNHKLEKQEIGCDENTPCVTNDNEEENILNNKKVALSIAENKIINSKTNKRTKQFTQGGKSS